MITEKPVCQKMACESVVCSQFRSFLLGIHMGAS